MIPFLSIFLFAFCLILWRTLRKTPTKEPPILSFTPSIVNSILFLLGKERLWEFLETLADECDTVGGLATTYVGASKYLVVTDPEIAAVLLNSCLEKDPSYQLLKPWLGNSVFLSPVSQWKTQRKQLASTFHPRLLQSFYGTFNKQAKRLTDSLFHNVGEPFDIFFHLGRNNVENVCETLLGLKDFNKDLVSDYLQAVQDVTSITMQRFYNILLQIEFIYNFTALKKKEDVVLKKSVHRFSKEVIDERKLIRRSISNNKDDAFEATTNIVLPIDKFLDLEEKGVIDGKEVRDLVDGILFAGHDTSAGSLRFFLMLVGFHNDVQNRIYEEIKNVFGDTKGDVYVTKEHIAQLNYLEAALKESMRLYPIGPLTLRLADKDLKIKNIVIRKGSRLALLHQKMNRHSMWGADADQFRPERWLEPGGVPSCGAAFSSFSWGKRNCVGQAYAMLSMKIILVHLLSRYRVSSDLTDLYLKFKITLTPTRGHLITLYPR